MSNQPFDLFFKPDGFAVPGLLSRHLEQYIEAEAERLERLLVQNAQEEAQRREAKKARTSNTPRRTAGNASPQGAMPSNGALSEDGSDISDDLSMPAGIPVVCRDAWPVSFERAEWDMMELERPYPFHREVVKPDVVPQEPSKATANAANENGGGSESLPTKDKSTDGNRSDKSLQQIKGWCCLAH